MRFDLRLPLGLLFVIFGAILVVQSFISPAADQAKSLGLDMNLRWGCVLLVFGGGALALALRARNRK